MLKNQVGNLIFCIFGGNMKTSELLEKILLDKNNRIKEIDYEIGRLNQKRNKIIDSLMKSTSFVPSTLANAISYLILAKEGKIYIPIKTTYFYEQERKEYCDLILVDAEYLNVGLPNKKLCPYDSWENMLPIYSVPFNDENFDNRDLTFSHLRKQFNIDVDMINKYNFRCNIYDYQGHEYIKDFITYLAVLQVKMDGMTLPYDEMLIAVYDFINMSKDKPKTKELNKN